MFNQNQIALGYPARANVYDPLPTIGTTIHQTKCLIKTRYSFAVQGGATGTVALVDDIGNTATLPLDTYVTNVVLTVGTSLASSASGSFGINLLTTGDLYATATTITAGTLYAGVPVGTAATWKGPVTSQQGTAPVGAITVGALTAIDVTPFIEFVIGNY